MVDQEIDGPLDHNERVRIALAVGWLRKSESCCVFPLFATTLALSLASCGVVQQAAEALAEACAREVQVVTTFEEGDDHDRICTPDRCTLRDAIYTANTCNTRQVIQLPPGTYQLTAEDRWPTEGPPTEERLRAGLPPIWGDVVIRGDGATIERASDVVPFRIFRVLEPGSLTLENVTVANGATSGWGGAIHNMGTLRVTNATLQNHSAGEGGAIYNDGLATLSRAVLRHNEATTGRGGAVSNNGQLIIRENSFLHDNRTRRPDAGGAIWNAERATVEVEDSEFRDNFANLSGGALGSEGTVTINKTTLSGNRAARSGGAVWVNIGSVTISKSLLDGNRAGADGGGISVTRGDLRINSSTLSGNESSLGGGIILFGAGTARLQDVTITGNTATSSGAGSGVSVAGGAMDVINTIVADNPGGDCASTGDFRASGMNMDSDNTCRGFTAHGDPLLGPLQDNGGPTRTHTLGSGSPAIDTGADCLSEDQRGFRRPVRRCDIGALEEQP